MIPFFTLSIRSTLNFSLTIKIKIIIIKKFLSTFYKCSKSEDKLRETKLLKVIQKIIPQKPLI